MGSRPTLPPLQTSDFESAFPGSHKVHVGGRGVEVPMREITLSGGEPALRVYDTSGPQGGDVREGLSALRRPWIEARGGVADGPRAWTSSGSEARPMPPVLARKMATALR